MKIGYLNYAFRETHALTFAGATVETGAAADLRKPQLDTGVVVRGTGTGSVAMHLQDLPLSYLGRTVQLVALLDVQVQTVGTVTALAWSVDVQGTTGGVTAAPVTVPEMPDGFPRHLLFLLPAPVEDCQLVRIYLDATGTGDIEVVLSARAYWAGPLFDLPVVQGAALATNDTVEIDPAGINQRTPGGQDYAVAAGGCRKHAGSTIWLEQSAVFGDGGAGMDLQALQMACGTHRPILWLPDTSSAHMLHRMTIYGRFTSTGRINRQQGKWRWDAWGVLESR